jgi:hypothetical protein
MSCAINILYIVKQCINPAFKIHGLPELAVKVGVNYGDAFSCTLWKKFV